LRPRPLRVTKNRLPKHSRDQDDEGAMWPTAFAPTGLTAAEEVRIVALVKKTAS
jgi:hypothetical protein